ncbi:MAG: chemotaxis protein CheB [Fidelibacterota bacterium]
MKPSHIVCIGASAGGLEALELFFISMPSDSKMAFVIIQHLSPDYKSLMPELLQKKTNMQVIQVQKKIPVQANTVYLIPPGNNMKIKDGELYLIPKDNTSMLNLPIDIFMKTLAMDQGEKSIGIILSGTGSDGMQGIRAIKEAGGMAIVQDKETAKFDGMPKSAISTGLIDLVLAPEDMPEQMIAYIHHPLVSKQKIAEKLLTDEDNLTKIFALLSKKKNIDFTYYKRSTLMRRIQRRLSVNHIKDLSEYVQLLKNSDNEINILQREFLIGVTNFFRDKEVFQKLADKYIPEIVKRKDNGDIRVWIAGCSSGEEAYSVAILFLEAITTLKANVSLKIFATDIDENAVFRAGQGIYPESIIADLDPKYLTKYFRKTNDNYQVVRKVRESVIFAQHNLIKDPPFTNVDFISCRNLLIYLQAGLQQKVMDLFMFSLNNSGILLLGKSESVGNMSDHFQQIHHKFKIFQYTGGRSANILGQVDRKFANKAQGIRHYNNAGSPGRRNFEESRTLDRYLQTLYGEYIPASIIVNEDYEILHTIGETGEYLNIPQGKLENNITKMVHKDLSIPISTGLQKVFNKQTEIKFSNITLHDNNRTLKTSLYLKPIMPKRGQQNLAAVFFETISEKKKGQEDNRENYDLDIEAKQRINDLEQELQYTRENLQATIEELETSNEELQATNEELLSSNEELQSTNEELQSVNEELYTVNSEYQEKITELTEVNNDISNLMESIEIATLFLDENLDIRKTTKELKNIISIDDDPQGESIYRYKHKLVDFNLLDAVKHVMEVNKTVEKEVKTEAGEYYMMKIKPYNIAYRVYSGVIITFVNISKIKKINDQLHKHIKWLNDAARLAKIGGWEIDLETGKTYWTDEVYDIHEVDKDFDHNVDVGIEFYHPDDRKKLEKAVRKTMKDGTSYDLECRFISAKGNEKIVRAIGTGEIVGGEVVRVYGSFQDITNKKKKEQKIKDINKQYKELFNTVQSGVILYKREDKGHKFIVNEINTAAEKHCNFKEGEAIGKDVREIFPRAEDIGFVKSLQKVFETGKSVVIKGEEYRDDNLDDCFDYEIYKLPNNEICTVFVTCD